MGTLDFALLERYVAGDCTLDERAEVERWLAEGEEHRRALDAIREVALQSGPDVSAERQEQMLARLRQRNAAAEFPVSVGRSRLWVRVAAALILAVGAAAGAYAIRGRTGWRFTAAASHDRIISTDLGQRLTVRLPDGTLATLAPASTLRVPSAYGMRERALQLVGQAAFTVTHDATCPFTVATERLVTRDLGTRFVIRAYRDEPAADVVVAEGKVSVARVSGGATATDTVVLVRGERARARTTGALVRTSGVSLDPYLAWADGQLVFDATPLGEVAAQLHRWYGVDVQLDRRLAVRPVTASFRTEPADEAIRLIAAILSLDVTRDGRGAYTFHAR